MIPDGHKYWLLLATPPPLVMLSVAETCSRDVPPSFLRRRPLQGQSSIPLLPTVAISRITLTHDETGLSMLKSYACQHRQIWALMTFRTDGPRLFQRVGGWERPSVPAEAGTSQPPVPMWIWRYIERNISRPVASRAVYLGATYAPTRDVRTLCPIAQIRSFPRSSVQRGRKITLSLTVATARGIPGLRPRSQCRAAHSWGMTT